MLEMVEGYRLSPQQRRLWARELESSAGGAAQCAMGIAGTVEPSGLRAAARRLVERHEALRTHFRRSPGMKLPLQVVGEAAEVSWREVDLRPAGPAALESSWEELRAEEASLPFDLERGALLRAALVRLADESFRLLLTAPALVIDAASLRNLFEDLCRLYGGLALDEEPVQHLQFSEWHNDVLAGEEAEAGRKFWRQWLSRFQDVGRLPLESADPAAGLFPLARWTFSFPPGVVERIAALTLRYDGSAAGFLLAAWHALLARLAGYGEVGTAFLGPNRKYRELDEAVGPFAIAVPVASRHREDLSFLSLWKRLEEELAAALSWQESFPPDGDAAGPSIGFELVEQPGVRQAGGAALTLLDLDAQTERFRLRLSCRLGEGSLRCVLSYAPERFPSSSIELLAERFETLVRSAFEAPERTLGELEILGPGERRRLLVEFNDTRTDLPLRTVDRLLVEAMERHSESAAVVAGETRLSHGGLLARAHQLAHHLRALGVGTDSLVAVCLPRSPELLVAILGILEAGGAFLPLDPGYPRQRLEFMLADSRARLLVTTGELLERLLAAAATPAVCLDRDAAAIAARPESDPGGAADPDALAYVIYTSGSTGRPKGTMIPHRGLANYLLWSAAFYRAGDGTGAPLHSPVGFDLTVTTLFAPLLAGAAVHLVPEEEGSEGLASALRARSGYSFVKLTPAHLEILGELLPPDQAAGRAATLVIGGEALRYGTLELWREHAPGTRLINEYGPTETVVGCCVHEVEPAEPATGTVPIGRPIANTALYLLDDRWHPVPWGAAGELFIGGHGLARGYLGRPDLTAERFVPDPFGTVAGGRLYRTGDRARFLAAMRLEFLGRVDGQVKVRGFRIELGEIESLLADHPGVREAAVVAKDDPSGTRLAAFYVADPGWSAAAGELRSFLQTSLPETVLPAAFVPLPALPLTANGKVDRAALREVEETPAAAPAHRAPRTQVEGLLADLWAQLLRRESVSMGDNFFDQGGHSLVAMQLIARIRSVFDVELAINDFLDAPTLAGLTARVEEKLQAGAAPPRPPLEPVHRSGDLPLSFAQERLWLLDQLQPGTAAYNVPAVFSFTGPLDPRALERSFNEIRRRHEVLRTGFQRRDGGLVQVIEPFSPRTLGLIDLGGLPEDARWVAVAQLTERWARAPFDLSSGSLVRALLMRLGESETRLLLTLHHIVCDAWSMEVLIEEWSALYTAFVRGLGSPLSELPVQYADYACWQRSWLRGEALDEQISFWRQRLESLPQALDLPTPRARPAVQTYRGAKRSAALPAPLVERVRNLARRERVTPFMTLLAAYETLLFRYAGQERFLVGSPITGRGHLKLEGLIGFFVNTLVLRAGLEDGPDFCELLGRVRRDTLSAFAHPDLPFEKLLEELPQERDISRPPLFQVVFSMQSPPALPSFLAEAPEGSAELALRALEVGTGTSKVDLNLEMTVAEHGMSATLEYNTDLFDEPAALRLLDHFEALLESAMETPDLSVSDLTLLRGTERRQILAEWSSGPVQPLRAFTLHRLFELQAGRSPERPAVVHGEASLTYGELNRRANRLARHLGMLGVGPEVLVGVCMERSLEMVVAILAVLKAGAAYVPLDPSYPMERLAFVLDDAGIPVLLTHERAGENLPSSWAFVVDVEAVEDTLGGLDGGNLDVPVEPENLAYAIYTSGSTGQPKGVLVPHAGLASLALAQAAAFGVGPDSRVLQFASLSFDASASELGMAFAAGAALVLADRESLMPGPELIRLFARQRISHATLPPSALAVLPAAAEVPATLIVAGEACPPDLVARWAPGRRLFNAYGPTECTVCATLTTVEPSAGRPPIGVPLANARVYLLDPGLALVPVGVPGELCVGGIGVARGYLKRPEITAERFVPDPHGGIPGARLYRTGDLARFLSNGQIEFLGRKDAQVKVRGFRIEPGEIEAALSQHRAVEQCVVVARADGAGGQRLVAYFVPREKPAPRNDELRDFLQQAVPAHLVPSLFLALPSLPLLPNGKVDRQSLPDPDRAGQRDRDSFVPPRNLFEEMLAGIWSEVLGIERCGAEDSFFDLGGYSLAATQVLSRVREVFGVDVPLGRLFARPTLAGLANEIETALPAGPAAVPPILPSPESSAAPLSFSQELMWRLEQGNGGAAVTTAPAALRLSGEIDPAVLDGSLREILRRHTVLRSTFPMVGGSPVQRVGPVPAVALPIVDLSPLPEGEREPALSALIAAEIRRPFDLAAGPVLRPLLIRLGEREHVLLLVGHHIAVDQWSAGVFIRELAVLYAALRAGESSPLPELSLQYRDFARWQRGWMRGEALDAELAYWRDRLAGAKLVELPAGGDRRTTATAAVLVSPERVAGLAALGRRQGATLFMSLLAVYQILLVELTSGRDILVASPVANRNRVEIEPLIGFFANTLILRGDLTGDPTFPVLLARVRDSALGAAMHQDLPVDLLAAEVGPELGLSREDLFRAGFNFLNAPVVSPDLSGVRIEPFPLAGPEMLSDLLLVATQGADGLLCRFQYRGDLSAAGPSGLADRFDRLLREIAEDPDQRLSALMAENDAVRG
jgi:amino acid adenylation domain-containing protein